MKSLFLDKINAFFACAQKFTSPIQANSSIVKNIDDVVFALVSALLILSLFCETNILGFIALSIIAVSFTRLFLIKGEKIELNSADVALSLFFLVLIFATINSTVPSYSFEGLIKYAIYFGYYFSIIPMFKRRRKKVLQVMLLIAALCTIESFYALLQSKTVMAGATWQDMSYVNPEDVISRIYGSLKPYNPNLLAGYLITGFPVVIGIALLTIEKRHRKSFFIALCGVLITLLAIFQTGCRGAYLALGAILFGFLAVSFRIVFYDFAAFVYLKKLWCTLTATIVSLCGLGLVCMPKILHRLMSIFLLRGDSSTSFRMNVYKSTLQMFADNPFFGIGPGNHTFREVYGYYMITGFDALGAYSVPLEIAVETGIFGVLTFFAFICILFVNSVKYICQDQSIRGKIYISVCIISVLGVMAHGLFDTIFFRPQVQFVFWTLVAALNGVLSRKELQAR